MNENQGTDCPECGSPRQADRTPSCACAVRAADALREAREREAAEAEDFDPLRVRPYVGLGGTSGTAPAAEPRVIQGEIVAVRDSEVTLAGPLPPEQPAPGADHGPHDGYAAPQGPDGHPPHGAHGAAATSAPGPAYAGAEPPEAAGAQDAEPEAGQDAGPRGTHRRRRTPRRRVAMVTAGSVVGVGAVIAGVTSGLFSYQVPSRTTSLPQRASVPDVDPTRTDTDPVAGGSPVAAATPDTSPSPSPSTSTEASADPSPSADASESPEPERSSTSASRPADAPESGTTPVSGSLGPGDSGPEVVELQRRLAELWLYSGDADGRYDDQVRNGVSAFQYINGIKDDEYGVYGAATRAALESITRGDGDADGRHTGRHDDDGQRDGRSSWGR
ncbi:peptidoglycan-binding domain-containing protein [Streptomyces fragilis]|uniref:Peptidoglycan-binding protein n=1 Tax=Streptomyces fragilis TaxID=67301 RepID=A0ABV2YAX7_9ACTN|nr:peptidoglycan-binding domain-containing protein [Streptomyces fragilis]